MPFLDLLKSSEANAVFKYPEFRRFVTMRVLFTLAILIQNVTLYWQVFEITGDALSLGIIGLAEALPALVVALYAGHLADNADRKKIAMYAFLLFCFCSLGLLLISLGSLENKMKVGLIYSVVFVSGIARGFYRPANFALLTQVIPKQYYANGIAWNSTFWQFASVSGSAIGGLILGYWGIKYSYFTAFILSLGGLYMMSGISSKPAPVQLISQSLKSSLTEGVKFVFKNQVMLAAISLDLVAVLFGGAVALLPVFAKEILHVGPIQFGLLNSAPAFGAILMAIVLAYYPPLKNAGKNLLAAVIGFGVCMIFFAISKNFYLSLFLLALSGMFDSVSVIVRSSIMQLLTPDNMRGRVSAVNTMFIGSSNELGAFESGFAAKLVGVIPSVVFGGTIAIAAAITTRFAAPKLVALNLSENKND